MSPAQGEARPARELTPPLSLSILWGPRLAYARRCLGAWPRAFVCTCSMCAHMHVCAGIAGQFASCLGRMLTVVSASTHLPGFPLSSPSWRGEGLTSRSLRHHQACVLSTISATLAACFPPRLGGISCWRRLCFTSVKILSLLLLHCCFVCFVEETLSYPKGIKLFLCG